MDVPADDVRASQKGRRRSFVFWIASAVVLAGVAIALTVRVLTGEGHDVADRPGATVWVKSIVRREEGKLRMEVDKSNVRVRDGDEWFRPAWIYMGSTIHSSIQQTGNEDAAPQTVEGSVTYVAPVVRWNLPKLRRETELASATFKFTGEFVAEPGGVRWWRVRRVEPSEGDPSLVRSK